MRPARILAPLLMAIVGLCALVVLPGVATATQARAGASSGGNANGSTSTTPASPSTPVWGSNVQRGSTLADRTEGNVHLSGMSVTGTTNSCAGQSTLGGTRQCTYGANISGQATFGSDSTQMAFTMVYSSHDRTTVWVMTIATGAAGTSYVQGSSPINLNTVSGTVTSTTQDTAAAVITSSLQVSNVAYHGVTMQGTATITSSGLQTTTTVSDMPLSGGQSAGSLQVISTSGSTTQQPAVKFGTSGTLVKSSVSFTDANNWTVTIQRGQSTGTAPSGAAVDVNNISGTITRTRGVLSGSLALTGAVVGDQSFDVNLAMSTSGFDATVSASEVTLAGGYRIDNPSITISTTSGASLSGRLEVNGTSVAVTAGYTDANDWNIGIQSNSTPSGYQPPSGSTVNITNLSGSITDVAGSTSFSTSISGVTVGDGTFTMNAVVTPSSVTASAVADEVTIGGLKFNSASISISTADTYYEIAGSLTTDAGSFDADVQATAKSTGGYHLHMNIDGADLSVGGPTFYMQSFGFSWDGDAPASGCTSFDVALQGTIVMGNSSLSLNNGEIAISCQTITKFIFSVTITHTTGYDNLTKSATLTINWFGTEGTYTPTFGPSADHSLPAISYWNGFFGTIDLSRTRNLTMEYPSGSVWPNFSRNITTGIGFNVAAYHEVGTSISRQGSVYVGQDVQGAAALSVGGIGYVSADRVSGDVGCVFQAAPGTDFTCTANMKINPEHAGQWSKTWTGL